MTTPAPIMYWRYGWHPNEWRATRWMPGAESYEALTSEEAIAKLKLVTADQAHDAVALATDTLAIRQLTRVWSMFIDYLLALHELDRDRRLAVLAPNGYVYWVEKIPDA